MATRERSFSSDTGAALLTVLLILLVIGLLGAFGLETGMDDRHMALALQREKTLTDLADSGLEIALAILNHGGPVPNDAIIRDPAICSWGGRDGFLSRRCIDSSGHSFFIDSSGRSQFGGTPNRPDFEWIIGPDTLGPPVTAGSSLTVRIAAPTIPGGVSSIESIAIAPGQSRRIGRVEAILSPWPVPLFAIETRQSVSAPIPVKVHWGDIVIQGDADLGPDLSSIPTKSSSAPITGDGYTSSGMDDRWVDIFASGRIVSPSGTSGQINIHENRADLRETNWSYEAFKAFARIYGQIYLPDAAGNLYAPGDPNGHSPADALSPLYNGRGRGFVFIDTLDQLSPKSDRSNFPTITLTGDSMEAHLYVAGDIVLSPGSGRLLSALSPPVPEGSHDAATRVPVSLTGVHISGAILAEGTVTIQSPTRHYGAVVARQGLKADSDYELWFDWNLSLGDVPDIPRVVVYPPSRRVH